MRSRPRPVSKAQELPRDGGPGETAEAIARRLPPSEDGTSQTELGGLFCHGWVNGFVNRVGKGTCHGQVEPECGIFQIGDRVGIVGGPGLG